LTFDDGPHPDLTPRLLDLLATERVPGTFFLIGREAEQHPEIVRRIVAEGHAVGSHSYSHPVRSSLSAREAAEEVSRGAGAIARITGRSPSLYRPPRGKLTAGDLWRLGRGRLTTVLWNVDPRDYATDTGDEVRSWFKSHPLRAGDLVLLHDTRPHALEILPELFAAARANGLNFATVEAWTS
jgi:peptidoglycan/xylan/chitin deacetylase (PgdA/CDA1 family)